MGIALFLGHNESIDNLLKHADLAMYHAKKGGRNRLCFFDPTMQATLVEHSILENDLRHAQERGQLRLHYQIQISEERRAAGAEALLRWCHPERGLIYPEQFIPLAEETGLIIPIGLWVLQKACAQLKEWSGNPLTSDLQLSVNVSVRQFYQANFVAQVQQMIVSTGINPERLKIELTESLVLHDVSDTINKMHALKALGISFSMDDFGTGCSSLSNLQQLPLDQLKIDQSFIRDLATNPNDAAIVQAVVTMGTAFGLNVIADGVETEAQRELLVRHGCHAFQGYLFNKPMPIAEFDTLIAQYA
jgi:EAL domain-containing protein (putative c-di-GMP-specific phosphodiesterase class I)